MYKLIYLWTCQVDLERDSTLCIYYYHECPYGVCFFFLLLPGCDTNIYIYIWCGIKYVYSTIFDAIDIIRQHTHTHTHIYLINYDDDNDNDDDHYCYYYYCRLVLYVHWPVLKGNHNAAVSTSHLVNNNVSYSYSSSICNAKAIDLSLFCKYMQWIYVAWWRLENNTKNILVYFIYIWWEWFWRNIQKSCEMSSVA